MILMRIRQSGMVDIKETVPVDKKLRNPFPYFPAYEYLFVLGENFKLAQWLAAESSLKVGRKFQIFHRNQDGRTFSK